MMMESLTSCFLWSVVVILAFLTGKNIKHGVNQSDLSLSMKRRK
jgi:hypothetical protein